MVINVLLHICYLISNFRVHINSFSPCGILIRWVVLLLPSLLFLSSLFYFIIIIFSFIFISWRLITLQYCSGFCHLYFREAETRLVRSSNLTLVLNVDCGGTRI